MRELMGNSIGSALQENSDFGRIFLRTGNRSKTRRAAAATNTLLAR